MVETDVVKRGAAFRDRIVELRRVEAKRLIANPRNWRRHPARQARALRGVLEEVGYARTRCWRVKPTRVWC